jgi:hypothetical protein
MFDVIVVQAGTMHELERKENLKVDEVLKLVGIAMHQVYTNPLLPEVEIGIRKHDPR